MLMLFFTGAGWQQAGSLRFRSRALLVGGGHDKHGLQELAADHRRLTLPDFDEK